MLCIGNCQAQKPRLNPVVFGKLALIAQIKIFRSHLHVEESWAFGFVIVL